jgi:hypothetical protein
MSVGSVMKLLLDPRRTTMNFLIVVMRFNRVVDESADRYGIPKTYIHIVGNVEVFVEPTALIVKKEAVTGAIITNVVDA